MIFRLLVKKEERKKKAPAEISLYDGYCMVAAIVKPLDGSDGN
jgi:hypothetical protein